MITFQQYLTSLCQEHKTGKNINWKQKISKNVRAIDKEDLSNDYPDHMANMGKTWPFKLISKKSKNKN